MPTKLFPYPDQENGTSLIEAMLSVAILAIAVLGVGMVMIISLHVTNATEQDVNQQQVGMHAEAFGTTLPTASTVSMPVDVPGTGTGNSDPLVTVANPVSLIPMNNLLTLSIGAGTGASSPTESVQYGVISSGKNKWWIP